MTKEKVQKAVVEETEVATAEAEVAEVEVAEATKETTKEEPTTTDETTDADEDELSPWYYFFAQGCGWCKKANPIVEGLIEDGHDVLMLDVAEPDNQKLNQELQTEYGTRCGTPWFINADTGKGICGFREKDILEKWLKGEDIPEPPRPTGPMPKVPYYSSTNKVNIDWKKTYNQWLKGNDHMGDDWKKRQRSASEIIDGPRPKSDPPQVPNITQASEEDIDAWGVKLSAWQNENKHMPNLQPVANVVENFKNRRQQMLAGRGAPQAAAPTGGTVDNTKLNSMDARVQSLEVKLNKLMDHFGVK